MKKEKKNERKYRDQDWLYDQYITLNRPIEDIAEDCGVTHHTIRFWACKLGIKGRKKIKRKKRLSEDKIKEIIELRKKLYSIDEIAEKTGVLKYKVTNIIREKVPDKKYSSRGRSKKARERRRLIENKKRLLDKLKKEYEEDKIDSKKACVILECNPAVNHFINLMHPLPIYNNDENIKIATNNTTLLSSHTGLTYGKEYISHIDMGETIQMIKNIEKIMFKLNLYRRKDIVVGTAIYLVNQITMFEVANLVGCSEASIRSLKNIIYKKS